MSDASDGQYGDWNRFAIAKGLRSTASAAAEAGDIARLDVPPRLLDEGVDARLRELFTRWCARPDLKALGLTLPAYLGYLGREEDRRRLRTALHMVHAARWLPQDEQAELEVVIGAVSHG
ncbi:hypothetical protein ACH4Q6_07730 [Streptomyces lydicus]|uniref:hypothetical protein n=1 Tax=Streptomyces lydicus TaxID=47763 RepID=UPI0037ACF20F